MFGCDRILKVENLTGQEHRSISCEVMSYSRLLLLLLVIVAGAQRAFSQVQGEPLCPTISVDCPDRNDSSIVTFTVNVRSSAKTTLKWTVSTGKIISGQGTATITVDTSGFEGQSLTATVEVSGLPIPCPNTSSCSRLVGDLPPRARKFDEYGDLSWAAEKARLDKFAGHLEPGIRITKALHHRTSSHRRVKRKSYQRSQLR